METGFVLRCWGVLTALLGFTVHWAAVWCDEHATFVSVATTKSYCHNVKAVMDNRYQEVWLGPIKLYVWVTDTKFQFGIIIIFFGIIFICPKTLLSFWFFSTSLKCKSHASQEGHI